MSLKDRLNSGMKVKPKQPEEIKSQVNINNTSDISNGINILDALLIDENINYIYINGAKNIFIERNGKLLRSTAVFRDNIQLTNLILKLAEQSGIEEKEFASYMDFVYKQGINIKAILPPVCNIPTLYIKCYHDKLANVRNFQDEGIISKELSLIFEALSQIKYNIIIAGEKNTLKTSILSSIVKSVNINSRCTVIDNNNELKLKNPACTIFNLSLLEKRYKDELLNSIINSTPDKIALNCNNETVSYFLEALNKGYKGIITTINASSKEDALNKLTQMLHEKNKSIGYEYAQQLIYKMFDLIIFCKKDETGERKITSISEIEGNDSCIIKDIFVLKKTSVDNEEFTSTGIIPKLYELAKNNSLSINPNIFVNDYKHTYNTLSAGNETNKQNIKKIDVLKKFKKELNSQSESIAQNDNSDYMKKVQEKFEELKKNAKIQEENKLQENFNLEATIQEINNSLNNTENIKHEV